MWEIKNQTPYAVERSWIRDRQGEEIWIVALKATWNIQPDGTTTLAAIQPPVNAGSVLYADGLTLFYDTDVGPTKTATDIVLNGHAHSPNGKAVSMLPVGLKVGNMIRLARVYGERIWNGSQYKPPATFTTMPLCYNKMNQGVFFPFCGSHYNPEGIPVDELPETGVSALPNIEFCDEEDFPGFGAQPQHWPGRLQFAGTYDENWRRNRAPLFPDDMDVRYWQCAPPPLYAGGRLKGGEVVCLGNMTPPGYGHNGVLIFSLPRIVPAFRTRFYDESVCNHRAALHTVIIEPDYPRVSLVWHSALPCHHLINQLESTTISEKRLFTRAKALPVKFPEWEALL
ncbi:DUF2169 family type VI secretion system accessory protein [Huaxiibacter chinensis]|uniref:DUF2169 family type VI secretion system accessory protein n=1 Tax=Huaxiibacter chinensis TaxID=2899785 RepID=UPI003D31AFF1